MFNTMTADEMDSITTIMKSLDRVCAIADRVLLGDIPVLDEDGLTVLGKIVCGQNYEWMFIPATPVTPTSHPPHDDLADRRRRLSEVPVA